MYQECEWSADKGYHPSAEINVLAISVSQLTATAAALRGASVHHDAAREKYGKDSRDVDKVERTCCVCVW